MVQRRLSITSTEHTKLLMLGWISSELLNSGEGKGMSVLVLHRDLG